MFGSLALAGLGAAPLAARAQVPTPPPTSQSQARVASTLGSSLHLTPQGSARVAHDPALAQQLRSMSDLTRDMYQSYTPAQKDLLYKALSGSTRVGFSVVDHQEAFVTGRALGRNAFPTIWNHVERKCQSEGLSDVESKQLKDHFLVLTTLPQAERAAFAALVLADQAPAAQ